MSRRTKQNGSVTLGFLLVYAFFALLALVAVSGGLGYLGSSGAMTSSLAIYFGSVVLIHAVDSRNSGGPWTPHSLVCGMWELYFAAGVLMYLIR